MASPLPGRSALLLLSSGDERSLAETVLRSAGFDPVSISGAVALAEAFAAVSGLEEAAMQARLRVLVRSDLLLEELAKVRRRGYATSFGEWDAGVNGIAEVSFG